MEQKRIYLNVKQVDYKENYLVITLHDENTNNQIKMFKEGKTLIPVIENENNVYTCIKPGIRINILRLEIYEPKCIKSGSHKKIQGKIVPIDNKGVCHNCILMGKYASNARDSVIKSSILNIQSTLVNCALTDLTVKLTISKIISCMGVLNIVNSQCSINGSILHDLIISNSIVTIGNSKITNGVFNSSKINIIKSDLTDTDVSNSTFGIHKSKLKNTKATLSTLNIDDCTICKLYLKNSNFIINNIDISDITPHPIRITNSTGNVLNLNFKIKNTITINSVFRIARSKIKFKNCIITSNIATITSEDSNIVLKDANFNADKFLMITGGSVTSYNSLVSRVFAEDSIMRMVHTKIKKLELNNTVIRLFSCDINKVKMREFCKLYTINTKTFKVTVNGKQVTNNSVLESNYWNNNSLAEIISLK